MSRYFRETYWLEAALIAALLCIAIAVPLRASAQTVVQNEMLRVAYSPWGSTIVIQPLDAPTNPYRNQYTDVDRWVFQRFDPQFTTMQNVQRPLTSTEVVVGVQPGTTPLRYPTTTDVVRQLNMPLFEGRMRVMVDQNGFLIPQRDPRAAAQIIAPAVPAPVVLTPDGVAVTTEPQAAEAPTVQVEVEADATPQPAPEADADPANDAEITVTVEEDAVDAAAGDGVVLGVTETRGPVPEPYFFFTEPITEADAEMLSELEQAQVAVVARALPPVPQWVSEHAPEHVMFLPDGRVVLDVAGEDGTTTVMYSPAGERLAELRGVSELPAVLIEDFSRLAAEAEARGQEIAPVNGYLLLRNKDTRKVEAVLDWDGSPLQLETTLQPRPYYFVPLRWENIQQLTAAQRRVPAAGRTPGAQQTTGTLHNVQQGHDSSPDK